MIFRGWFMIFGQYQWPETAMLKKRTPHSPAIPLVVRAATPPSHTVPLSQYARSPHGLITAVPPCHRGGGYATIDCPPVQMPAAVAYPPAPVQPLLHQHHQHHHVHHHQRSHQHHHHVQPIPPLIDKLRELPSRGTAKATRAVEQRRREHPEEAAALDRPYQPASVAQPLPLMTQPLPPVAQPVPQVVRDVP
jgi:hypothetical protein